MTLPTALQEATESLGTDRTLYADTGEMRERVRDLDWSATPLGPMAEWPQSLRTSVDIVLGSAFPQILLWGPELVQIYNDGYRDIMGSKHPRGLGMPTVDCWPEITHVTRPIYERVLAGETVTYEDARFSLERGREMEDVYLTLSYSPVHGDDDEIAGIFITLLETTRRVRAAEMELERARLLRELEVERRRLEEVFQQAPAFLAVVRGSDHVFEFANHAYLELVGRSVVSRPVADALPEMVDQGFLEVLDDVLHTGKPFVGREIPVKIRRGKGGELEERFLDFVYQPLTEADGTRVGVVAHGSDVTEHTLARRDLELAREIAENARREAEQANHAKSEFLTTMSHELRTPLNAVAGYADLLLMGVRGELTEAQREDLERIKRSGQYLLGLINDVLNFAKLDAGQVEFRVDEVAVSELLEGLEDLIRPQMNAKGLLYHHGNCLVADTMVCADPEKVRQILLNLLSNAAKFTEPGGEISLSCDVDDTSVRMAVHDNGRGIAADQLARVFDPFVQVDRHLTPQSQQGVGLGLAISRDLANGMGGRLEAESTVDRGSTFTLTLPRSEKL